MAQATSNPDMIKRTRALAAFSSAKEYASIQRAIIAAALPADPKQKGELNENDRLYGLRGGDQGATTPSPPSSSLYESMGGDAEELMAPLNGQGNPEIQASEKYADRVLGIAGGLAERAEPLVPGLDRPGVHPDQRDEDHRATLLSEMESKARELRSKSQRTRSSTPR